MTPLQRALLHGHVEVVKFLLEARADVRVTDKVLG